MYLGNSQRTSYDPDRTAFNLSNANATLLNWTLSTMGPIFASPIVNNGTIFFGSWDGDEYAANESSGTLIWTTYLGVAVTRGCPTYGVTSSAEVWNGSVYLGGGDGRFYALSPANGTVEWSVLLGNTSKGYYLWSSPLIYRGNAYIGVSSGCDNPLVPAGLAEISLTTHLVINFFHSMPGKERGASIWSSPSVDPIINSIFVTTGNPGRNATSPYAEAVVSLNATTLGVQSAWQVPPAQAFPDGDFGATPIVVRAAGGPNLVVATNKNGYTYAWNETNLSAGPLWADKLSHRGGHPSIATVAFDGKYLYVGAVNTTVAGASHAGAVYALNPSTGTVRWVTVLSGAVLWAPMDRHGLLSVSSGNRVVILKAATGKELWTYSAGSMFGSPSVMTNDRILAGNIDGDLYAFSV